MLVLLTGAVGQLVTTSFLFGRRRIKQWALRLCDATSWHPSGRARYVRQAELPNEYGGGNLIGYDTHRASFAFTKIALPSCDDAWFRSSEGDSTLRTGAVPEACRAYFSLRSRNNLICRRRGPSCPVNK